MVPTHIPRRQMSVINPNLIPSQPPTASMLLITIPTQTKLNTVEVINRAFLEILRDIKKMIIATTIPMSNIGVHPSNIKAAILFPLLYIFLLQNLVLFWNRASSSVYDTLHVPRVKFAFGPRIIKKKIIFISTVNIDKVPKISFLFKVAATL